MEQGKKCIRCGVVNFSHASYCVKCSAYLVNSVSARGRGSLRFWVRLGVLLGVCAAAVAGFYVSLIVTSKPLSSEQKLTVARAIEIVRQAGFQTEARNLSTLATFRSTDNWLNASVAKESAYAATNFPFEIMTLYPDFFTYPADDLERAAILLHEAKHLEGEDEKGAYGFVWKHRGQLGWTGDKYRDSVVWTNVRRQTLETVPELFICDFNEFSDCTGS